MHSQPSSSAVSVPVKPKRNVSCAMGIYCFNMRKPYYEWLERTQQSGAGASSSSAVPESPPPKPTRGTLVPVGSALQNHFDCFLPCGHFCCNWVPAVGVRVGALQPGQTCATLHPTRCNGKGNLHFDALWHAAAQHKMLTATRPAGVKKAAAEYITYATPEVC